IVRPFLMESGAGSSPASRTDLAQMAREILHLPIENKLAAMEEALVSEAVALSHGNKSAAARLLGVHRKTLGRRAHDVDKNGQR
ncbi:MAG TPA: helix-turn-helix domain-containing protein, partial [Polyangia bacterium]|nr:helix-turn-helix domain-containing protein [Polyangia bacterium]